MSSSEGRRPFQGVRTHSLSALSSLASPGDLVDGPSFRVNDSIWDSPPLFAPSMDPDSPFPDFRSQDQDSRWFLRQRTDINQDQIQQQRSATGGGLRRHTPQQQRPQKAAADMVSPLIAQFAESISRELSEKLREALSNGFEPESLEHLLLATTNTTNNNNNNTNSNQSNNIRQHRRRTSSEIDLEVASSTSRGGPASEILHHENTGSSTPVGSPHHLQQHEDNTAGLETVIDELRQTVATIVMRLSTLEGRQRALQGKMAKLDGAWGGDASQMGLAIAELQHVVANQTPNAEFGSLRGQFFSLAHTIDKLDKRLASVERRLGGGGTTPPPNNSNHPPVPAQNSANIPNGPPVVATPGTPASAGRAAGQRQTPN